MKFVTARLNAAETRYSEPKTKYKGIENTADSFFTYRRKNYEPAV
jgi:hypothetical protein